MSISFVRLSCLVIQIINYMLCAHARMITASKCLSTVRNCQKHHHPKHQHIVLSDLLSIIHRCITVLYGITAVRHINAHPRSCGPTEKLLFQLTSFFGCSLICLLLSPSAVRAHGAYHHAIQIHAQIFNEPGDPERTLLA